MDTSKLSRDNIIISCDDEAEVNEKYIKKIDPYQSNRQPESK